MSDKLFSMDALATLAGASYLVWLVVSYTKAYIPMPTDLYAIIVSFVVLLPAQLGMGASAMDWRVWFLSACNAFLVASLAGRANDEAVRKSEPKAPGA